jgi:hypothetical protein
LKKLQSHQLETIEKKELKKQAQEALQPHLVFQELQGSVAKLTIKISATTQLTTQELPFHHMEHAEKSKWHMKNRTMRDLDMAMLHMVTITNIPQEESIIMGITNQQELFTKAIMNQEELFIKLTMNQELSIMDILSQEYIMILPELSIKTPLFV